MTAATPSLDAWLAELKQSPDAARVGMYLVHNGVVRASTRAGDPVSRMDLSVDRNRLDQALEVARAMPGIFFVRAWVNEGLLEIGDDIMYVLVGGDIRPNVLEALISLVSTIKTEVVVEREEP